MNRPPNKNVSLAMRPALGEHAIIDTDLLDLLLRTGGPMTVQGLALELRQTPKHILQELVRLERAGCQIQTHPQRGLTLVHSGLAAWADYLEQRHPLRGGRIIQVYAKTTSTQDAARRIVESCGLAADGAVAIADRQTAGRGRLGRRWVSPAGAAVAFTRVCLLKERQPSIDRLMLAVTVSVTQAIEKLIHPTHVQIKWPNDIMIDGKKLAGILVETFAVPCSPQRLAAIIGIGINVTVKPQDLSDHPLAMRDRVTSILEAGRQVDRLLVLSDTLRQMDEVLDQPESPELLNYWRRHCPLVSKPVRLRHDEQTISGRVIDLDPSAGLIVRTESGAVVNLPAATTTILDYPL